MTEVSQPPAAQEYDFDRWVSLEGDDSAFDAAERLQRSRFNQARHAVNIRVFDREGRMTSPRWIVPATEVSASGDQVRGIRLITGVARPRFLANEQVHCVDRRYMD